MNDLARQVTAIDLQNVRAVHISRATAEELQQLRNVLSDRRFFPEQTLVMVGDMTYLDEAAMNAAGWFRK